MKNKVNWGVLGTASIAYSCTIPGMLQTDSCYLYAIAGRNKDKVAKFVNEFGFEKGYTRYDDLLKDSNVDAIYIPLTNNLHKEWVIKALNAKKHVLCEKPMALNANDAIEMFKAAQKNGVYLMEAFAYLHGEYMKSLVNDVKNGIIGDIVYIDTAFVTQGYETNFRLHKNLGGGMIYDLGCYCTSMILSLVDSDIEYAKAIAEKNENGVDSFSSSIIKFKNGARASFNVGMILGTKTNARYDKLYIHGTKGDIKSDAEYNGDGVLSYKIISNGQINEKKITVLPNYSLEINQLNDCILNNAKPYISKEFTIKNASLIDTLLDSID